MTTEISFPTEEAARDGLNKIYGSMGFGSHVMVGGQIVEFRHIVSAYVRKTGLFSNEHTLFINYKFDCCCKKEN
jgi:hypothetical protein